MCIDAIQFSDPPLTALGERRRILASGGRLAVTASEPTRPADERLPERTRRMNLARHLAEAGFEQIEVTGKPDWYAAERALWKAAVQADPNGDPALEASNRSRSRTSPTPVRIPATPAASAVSCSTCSGITSRCSTWCPSDASHSAYRPPDGRTLIGVVLGSPPRRGGRRARCREDAELGAARLIRDGYGPGHANAALRLLPEWTQWCIGQSGLDGDLAARSRAAALTETAALVDEETNALAAERDRAPFRRQE
jgi:hypothetical protein